jgi:hypothetical protein
MNLLKSYSRIKSSVWNRQGKRNYNTLRFDDTAESLKLNKDRFITIAILAGIFGGLVGGPVTSLVYFNASGEERFKLFVVPEVIGFICVGLMIYYNKTKN